MSSIDADFLRELRGLRATPLETTDLGSIPCDETSDSHRLCADPVVSILMVTYNHEPYIRQAIEGILCQQTDFPFELIIGEDCSTDTTRRICLEYQARNPGVVRVMTSAGNVGSRRNGMRIRMRARGQYVAYCEGDDYWCDPHRLQNQLTRMQADNYDMCVAFWNVLEDGKIVNTCYAMAPQDIRLENFRFFHISTWLVKRDLLERARESSCAMVHTDMSLLTYFIMVARILVYPSVVSVHRVTHAGVWSSLDVFQKQKREITRMWQRYDYYPRRFRWFFGTFLIRHYYELLRHIAPKKNLEWVRELVRERDNRKLFLLVIRNIGYISASHPRSLWAFLKHMRSGS